MGRGKAKGGGAKEEGGSLPRRQGRSQGGLAGTLVPLRIIIHFFIEHITQKHHVI